MSCPELLRTQAYLDGELEGVAASEAERHIETCAECKQASVDAAQLSDAIRSDAMAYRAPEALRHASCRSSAGISGTVRCPAQARWPQRRASPSC
jgi:anti-sigma factor RsiW